MKHSHFNRLLALFLVLCTILSLLPATAAFPAQAEKAPTRGLTEDNTSLATTLTTTYNNILIPITQKKTNFTSLGKGIYFLVAWNADATSNHLRTYNFADNKKATLRLTANSLATPVNAADPYYKFASVAVTVNSSKQINQINSAAVRDFTYAVEIGPYPNAGNIKRNNTTPVEDAPEYIGWQGRVEWEYKRSNNWSNNKKFSTYLQLPGRPTNSSPWTPYYIKSLNPSLSAKPYFAFTNNSPSMWLDKTAYPFFFKANDSKTYTTLVESAKIYKMDHTGSSALTYWLGWDRNTNYMTGATLSQIVREDKNYTHADDGLKKNQFEMDWQVYRVSDVAVDLYRALMEAKSYVTGKNDKNQYPAETYNGFLKFIQKAFTTYNSKRTVYSDSATHADRITCDALAKDVRSYIELLKIEEKYEYMDIPMEVLDFRADGLLFEGCNSATAYSLAYTSPVIPGYNLSRPGTVGECEEVEGRYYVEGLVQPELVNGKIAYTEETVTYIAYAYHSQHHTFDDPAAVTTNYKKEFGTDDMQANYNSTFMTFVDPITGNRPSTGQTVGAKELGSYNQTLTKVAANDGYLPYNQVTTCFDLAYYTLNNIWSQTRPDDIVQTKDGKNLPYNKKIEELHTMRLLKDGYGVYHFKSALANGRCLDSGLIFNYPAMNAGNTVHPYLNNAYGLGFEGSGMFPIATTGGVPDPATAAYSYANYLVMYHVKSSFVYYESKELNFKFTGDDDVYFFVNGKLICDIGGMHSHATRSCDLNAKVANGDIDLRDGDICTFDMYLVDRHSTGINMNLSTNIDMMPVGAVTDKVQYEYLGVGKEGETIPDGGVVTDGTEVGYGFKLLNRSEHGATDLTFQDDALGVTLNGTTVALGGHANVQDLQLIYRTYDPQTNKVCTDTPSVESYDTFSKTLAEAVDDMSTILPLEEGAYLLTGLTVAQIQALMTMGLPANVQLSVMGFHRKVSSTVGGYTNVVKTTLRPIEYRNTDGSYTYLPTISGYAVRNLSVQSLNNITAEPLQLVLDYGKPVLITDELLQKSVTYDPADVSLSYAGLMTQGKHGKPIFDLPKDLRLTHEGDEPVTTVNGTYDRAFSSVRFTPDGMLEAVERIYALICVHDTFLGDVWYLTVEIQIIPATLVYYEAEDLLNAGELSLSEKRTEKIEPSQPEEIDPESTDPTDPTESTEPTETTPEETTPSEVITYNESFYEAQDTLPRDYSVPSFDPTLEQNILFFGFNNTSADRKRYSDNQVYGKTNFDLLENWWTQSYSNTPTADRNPTLANGVLSFSTKHDANTWGYAATGKADPNNKYTANKAQFPLNFVPGADDWCEIRLKVDKTATNDLGDPFVRIEFFPEKGLTPVQTAGVSTKYFSKDHINNGFFTLKFPLSTVENTSDYYGTNYADLNVIRRINFLVRNMDKSEIFYTYYDYLYIGPEEHCPSNYGGEAFYVGFDNTAADQYRYNHPYYGGSVLDYDGTGSRFDWFYDSAKITGISQVDSHALALTVAPTGNSNTGSPYIQTGRSESDPHILSYPAHRADVAQLRLKLENLATVASDSTDSEDGMELFPTLRLDFYSPEIDNEQDECYIEYPLTEEQLTSGDYFTLSLDIGELLSSFGVKTLTGLRITLLNVAGKDGSSGTLTIDEIYVGPRSYQDTDAYVDASETLILDTPTQDTYSPKTDSRVVYFGFENTQQDQYRYTHNPVYGGKNFDTIGNWWKPNYGGAMSIGNGCLTFSSKNTNGDDWGYVGTGYGSTTNSSQAEFPLTYYPDLEDWCEVRLKVDFTSLANTANPLKFRIEFFPTAGNNQSDARSTHSFPSNYTSGQYVTLKFKLNTGEKGSATGPLFKDLTIARRLNLMIMNVKANTTFTATIDYFYIGPKDRMPSALATDRLFFDFTNEHHDQFKYNSELYGNSNFDLAAPVTASKPLVSNWRYGRFTGQSVANGMMTYTLNSDPYHWFETQRGSTIGTTASNNCVLHYKPTKAEVLQVRMRFRNVEMVDPESNAYLKATFSGPGEIQAEQREHIIDITPSQVATSGKWFTFEIPIRDEVRALSEVICFRLRLDNVKSTDGKGAIDIDYIYIGPSLLQTSEAYRPDEQYTYGYDSSYLSDGMYSDHHSLYVEGKGVPTLSGGQIPDYDNSPNYTEVSFSFTGTGFDLISRTGQQQATIRLSVYTDETRSEASRVKTLTVNNKGELELYQIPVASVQGLPYGTYYVSLWVNDKVTLDSLPQIPGLNLGGLTRGNEFFIDGIRVYDPIWVDRDSLSKDQTTALEAYRTDREAYHYVKEIRNLLLTKEAFDTLNGTIAGAVFIDVNSSWVDPETGNILNTPSGNFATAHITTYNQQGPKNEVYLAPSQAIAFRLAVDTAQPLDRLDIAAKIIQASESGTLAVGFVEGDGTVVGTNSFPIASATAQYATLSVTDLPDLTAEGIYLVIYSTGESVISITDIKAAYTQKPDVAPSTDSPTDPEIKPETKKWTEEAPPVRFLVDSSAPTAAATFVKAYHETPVDPPTEEPPVTEPPVTEPNVPNIVQGIAIGHSLNLASDIAINYAVPATAVEDYEDLSMVCTIPIYAAGKLEGERTVVLSPERRGDYIYFTLTGLTAVNMNDTVHAVLTMTKDGILYEGEKDVYSICTYAMSQLNREKNPDNFKTLCANLLRYGADAQIFKGYRTDALATEAMTPEHLSYLTDLETVTFDPEGTTTAPTEGSNVTWAGKALLLDSKVTIRYILNLSKYNGNPADLRIELRYTAIDGTEKTATLTDPTVYHEEKGFYAFDFDGLLAAELRQVVSATVFLGETPVTGTMDYCASSYGNGKAPTLTQLCKSLMAYSDSAKAFFLK